ncbi:MAG: hypothetical protein V4469_03745 [Patescibacteria group bacterium]
MKSVPLEFVELSKALRLLPGIKQSRVSPRQLFKAYLRKMTFILRDAKGIYAFGALWSTGSRKWLEIGTVWVRKDHGKQGKSSEIITTLDKRAKKLKRSTFLSCSSENKQMRGTMVGMDYKTCKDPRRSPLKKVWGKSRDATNRSIFYFQYTP